MLLVLTKNYIRIIFSWKRFLHPKALKTRALYHCYIYTITKGKRSSSLFDLNLFRQTCYALWFILREIFSFLFSLLEKNNTFLNLENLYLQTSHSAIAISKPLLKGQPAKWNCLLS